jgi:hypothetical protein
MRDFFRGWRRKAGIATLVLACCFASIWVSSTTDWPEAYWLNVQLECYRGGIKIQLKEATVTSARRDSLGSVTDSTFVAQDLASITLPYWSFTIPLTLLSAYLLLIPSRKRPPTTSQPHA